MVDAAPLTNNINFKKIYYAIYYFPCNSFNKHNCAAIRRLTQINHNL